MTYLWLAIVSILGGVSIYLVLKRKPELGMWIYTPVLMLAIGTAHTMELFGPVRSSSVLPAQVTVIAGLVVGILIALYLDHNDWWKRGKKKASDALRKLLKRVEGLAPPLPRPVTAYAADQIRGVSFFYKLVAPQPLRFFMCADAL
jgi:hypothetical protein